MYRFSIIVNLRYDDEISLRIRIVEFDYRPVNVNQNGRKKSKVIASIRSFPLNVTHISNSSRPYYINSMLQLALLATELELVNNLFFFFK